MTKKDWFIVQNSIVDRDDLSVYEKMCCVVLARYADKEEFDDLLTSDIIALKMGVDSVIAKKAVFGLIEKGLINFEGKTRTEINEEIYGEEEKIKTILEKANNENILKNEEASKKMSMEEFKKRLNAIKAVKDDKIVDVFKEEARNIVKSNGEDNPETREFDFANLNFEDMFDDDSNKEDKSNDQSSDLDEEFEKTLINDEWISELEKIEDIIQKENLDDTDIYSSLSEEAKYHLGMLDDKMESLKNPNNAVVKSESIYKKKLTSKASDKYHSLVDQVYEILDEQINEREARIILSFANNDIDKIREKYRIAKKSQINDKIEVLINELQKKDNPSSQVTQISEEEMEKLPGTQLNIANINKMKMYSKYSKK